MSRETLTSNPFVGLRPFESEDSLYYFGRNEQTKSLLSQLLQSRFLAVVGSSGCGKSSLVRAGLIPNLQAGFLVQDRDLWRIGKMKPGDRPLGNLAAAVLAVGSDDPSTAEVEALEAAIRSGGSAALLQSLWPNVDRTDSNLLILVDQFEELFRFARPEDSAERREEAAEFVALLLDLAEQPEAPVYICLTMRSDFLGDCDAYYGLPEAMNRGQYLVPRLTRSQRREAITGPIHLSGATIAPRLVDRLLNENIGTRDDLPVLQHALMRTWARWQEEGAEGPIDLPHYGAVGTVQGALDAHAEQALAKVAKLDEGSPAVARRLFQCLTEIDATNRRIRRPAHLQEIAAVAETTPEKLFAVIQKFREDQRNFLVLSSESLADDPLVDICHESLIRQWKTLETWVAEEAESAQIYRYVDETAVRHEAKKAELWRGAELQVALEWRDKTRPTKAWANRYGPHFDLAMMFLDKSQQAAKDLVLERERQRQRELKRSWLLTLVMSALFAVSFISAAAIAWWAHKAEEQQQSARRLLYVANINLAQQALESRSFASADALLSEFLPPGEATPSDDVRSFAWYRLWRILHHERNTLAGHSSLVSSVAFSPDSKTLASGSQDRTIKLWEIATGKELATFAGHSAIGYVAFSPDGKTLASGSADHENEDYTIKLWDLRGCRQKQKDMA